MQLHYAIFAYAIACNCMQLHMQNVMEFYITRNNKNIHFDNKGIFALIFVLVITINIYIYLEDTFMDGLNAFITK